MEEGDEEVSRSIHLFKSDHRGLDTTVITVKHTLAIHLHLSSQEQDDGDEDDDDEGDFDTNVSIICVFS